MAPDGRLERAGRSAGQGIPSMVGRRVGGRKAPASTCSGARSLRPCRFLPRSPLLAAACRPSAGFRACAPGLAGAVRDSRRANPQLWADRPRDRFLGSGGGAGLQGQPLAAVRSLPSRGSCRRLRSRVSWRLFGPARWASRARQGMAARPRGACRGRLRSWRMTAACAALDRSRLGNFPGAARNNLRQIRVVVLMSLLQTPSNKAVSIR